MCGAGQTARVHAGHQGHMGHWGQWGQGAERGGRVGVRGGDGHTQPLVPVLPQGSGKLCTLEMKSLLYVRDKGKKGYMYIHIFLTYT